MLYKSFEMELGILFCPDCIPYYLSKVNPVCLLLSPLLFFFFFHLFFLYNQTESKFLNLAHTHD